MNTLNALSQNLSSLTYNGSEIQIPKNEKLNIYMGIGLWSKKNGLSKGLPIDVMQMLLAATVLRSKIQEENPDKKPRVIILIADSMALREMGDLEGASKESVIDLVALYKKSLKPLLELLGLQESAEIVLSSELEQEKSFQSTLNALDSSIVLQVQKEDKDHYNYIYSQTAISHYMHMQKDVGVKIGWICKQSSQQLKNTHLDANCWDELKFDRICSLICPSMQYLYTKAGLKLCLDGKGKLVNVREGCPYTAYTDEHRYIVQVEEKNKIKSLPKSLAAHWKGVAEICQKLSQMKVVQESILPTDCIKKSNDVLTTYNMLNHWVNLPAISKGEICQLS